MEKSEKAAALSHFIKDKPIYIPPLSLFAEFITEDVAKEYIALISNEPVTKDRMYRLLSSVSPIHSDRLYSIPAFDCVQPFIMYGKRQTPYRPVELPARDFPQTLPLGTLPTYIDTASECVSLTCEARMSISPGDADTLFSSLPDNPLGIQNIRSAIDGLDGSLCPQSIGEPLRSAADSFQEAQRKLLTCKPSTTSKVIKAIVEEREEASSKVHSLFCDWKKHFKQKGVKEVKNCPFSVKLKQRMESERKVIETASKEVSNSIAVLENLQAEVHGVDVAQYNKEEKEREEKSNGGSISFSSLPPVPTWDGSSSSSSSKRKGEMEVEEATSGSNGSAKKKLKSGTGSESLDVTNTPALKGKRKSMATRSSSRIRRNSKKKKKKKESEEVETPHLLFETIQSIVEEWAVSVSSPLEKESSSTHDAVSTFKSLVSEGMSGLTKLLPTVNENDMEVEEKNQPQSLGKRLEMAYHGLLSQLEKEHKLLKLMKQPSVLLKDFPFDNILTLLRSLLHLLGKLQTNIHQTEILSRDVDQICEWSAESVESLRTRFPASIIKSSKERIRNKRQLNKLKSSLIEAKDELEENALLGMDSNGSGEKKIKELEKNIKRVQKESHDLTTTFRRNEMMLLREVEKFAPELLLDASWTKTSSLANVNQHGVKILLDKLPGLRSRLVSEGLDLENISLDALPEVSFLPTQGRHRILQTIWEDEDVVLKEYMFQDNKDYARLVREVHTLNRMSHPYITEVKCVFKDKNHMYVVMPFYGGGSLSGLWKDDASPPPAMKEIQMYMRQAVLALAHVHERHIVHCDIKPDNILLTTTSPPHVVLTDFDVSKSSSDRAMTAAVTLATTPGGMTLRYAAPELLLDPPSSATSSSDIYSLGLTFFDLLFPNHPLRPKANSPSFDTKRFLETWAEYRKSAPSAIFEDDEVDENLVQLLGVMLTGNPKKRPSANMVLAHPFFSEWEKNQISRLERLEEKEVERKGDLYSCCVCLADDVYEIDGVVCPVGDRAHFLCRDCFARKIEHDSHTADDNGFVKRRGSIYCIGYSGKKSPCHSSCSPPPSPYTDQTIASCTNDEVFTHYMDGKKAFLEAELAAANEKVVKERVERALEENKRLTERERQVRNHANYIRESVLTICCPHRGCGQAFVDFDGCFALSCSLCRKHFCGWCLAPASDNDSCHAHVRRCSSRKSRDAFFGSLAQFEENNNTRRRASLRVYLSSLPDDLSKEVVEAVRRNLLELGIREW